MYFIYKFNSKAKKKGNVQNEMSIRYGWIRMHAPKKQKKQTKNTFFKYIIIAFNLALILSRLDLDNMSEIHWKYFDLFLLFQ